MRLNVEINGERRELVLERVNGGFDITLDGRRYVVDARRLEGRFVSLIISEPSGARPSHELVIDRTSRGALEIGRAHV